MKVNDLTVVLLPVNDLNPSEYNPRKITGKDKKYLKDSLDEFGMVEPIIVNSAPERKNIIIGGHQRYYLLKEQGEKTVPCIYLNIPDIKKERELNLRLNKNLGEWDWELLANFDENELLNVGFDKEDFKKNFGIEDPIDPEIPFSEELLEAHNYVVLYFDNEMDWNVAQDKLGIKPVKDAKGLNKGIGRVIKGIDVINKLP